MMVGMPYPHRVAYATKAVRMTIGYLPLSRIMAAEVTTEPLHDWQREFRDAIRDPVELCRRLQLPESLHDPAIAAAKSFPVFVTSSYIDRMRLGDLNDPLLRQVLPLIDELESPNGFSTDPVDDLSFKQQPGLLQKYRGRVLLITTGLCAIHCRYCFRRHFPYDEEPRSLERWKPALDEIRADDSIHEVILSGGDPLSLNDRKLAWLVEQLDEIPHLQRLRIHTRLPIVLPSRVTDDLVDWMSTTRLTTYFVLHANHANELDDAVWQSVKRLRSTGAVLLNQAVLLRGVNDSVQALHHLCESLSDHGVLPYYLHQLDRVQGAAHFEVPVERGMELISALRGQLPGYAVPRYVQENSGEPNKTVLL